MAYKSELLPYQIIDGRNVQRAMNGGELTPIRARAERRAMEVVLAHEQRRLDGMNLITAPLSPVEVNPNLTIFLDGQDGLGGYADIYARSESQQPGTRIEMEQEREIIKRHLDATLTPDYINGLRADQKPLVIIEGGAGPDLRTFGVVTDVLAAKADTLQGVKIQMAHVDISKRMAAITTAKARTSGIPEKLKSLGLQAEIAICHADVFDVLEKVRDVSLTYALLPFGVLSFGLDGKNPHGVMEGVRKKLRLGGGTLATVYNSDWREYTQLVEHCVDQINLGTDAPEQKMNMNDLNPFVIRILNGKMQVGGGLEFNCTTFTPDQLSQLVKEAGLSLDTCAVTPRGWAYWPDEMLNKIAGSNVLPGGPRALPPGYAMDYAKKKVLTIAKNAGGQRHPKLMHTLSEAIPTSKTMHEAPAPYITVTARKTTADV